MTGVAVGRGAALGRGERQSAQSIQAPEPRNRRTAVRVELLHHPGCRSAPAVYQLVQDCLTVLAIPTAVHVRVGAYPSPTVLVDGTDVMDPCRGTPLGHS